MPSLQLPSFIPFPFVFLLRAACTCFHFFPFIFKSSYTMVYLIHFSQKLHHAQHYIGYTPSNLPKRIARHKSGHGAKLLAAVTSKGIEWQVVRVWRGADRAFERKLKNYKKARVFCPVCGAAHHL